MRIRKSKLKIAILGDSSFKDYDLLSSILSKYDVKGVAIGCKNNIRQTTIKYVTKNNLDYVPLKDADLVLVFYGTDTSLIKRIEKARDLGKKIKIIKYLLL